MRATSTLLTLTAVLLSGCVSLDPSSRRADSVILADRRRLWTADGGGVPRGRDRLARLLR